MISISRLELNEELLQYTQVKLDVGKFRKYIYEECLLG
jgi:hypothetical protein